MVRGDERRRMVEQDLAGRGITDARVLDAFRAVPRHRFVPREHRDQAYADRPLPLGDGQTISQPYIVAVTVQALQVEPGDRVLDVGTGSAYAAAILARLADEVHTIERIPGLAARATSLLADLGLDHVTVHVGDGSRGLAGHAPFDVIAVAAASPDVPVALTDQLAVGGRLVLPIGAHGGPQQLTLLRRQADDAIDREELVGVRFVPLVTDR